MARPPLALGHHGSAKVAGLAGSGSLAVASTTSTASLAGARVGRREPGRSVRYRTSCVSAAVSAPKYSDRIPGSLTPRRSGRRRSPRGVRTPPPTPTGTGLTASCSLSSASCACASATSHVSTPFRAARKGSAHRSLRGRFQLGEDSIRREHPSHDPRDRQRDHAASGVDQAVASNPVRELERIESPKGHRKAPPRGLTVEERRQLLAYVDSDKLSVGADLPDLIRFAIGSGLRVGELRAVRWMDLNLDGIPVVTEQDMRLVPIAAVTGNLVYIKRKGLVRHDGKTPTALRIVPLPELVTSRLRARRHGDESPEWPVFPATGQDGQPTYRWPSNVRRTLRKVREEVGLGWMTPHTWRRTYATILDDEISLTDRAKADLMGQAKFLKDTHVSRGELHPDAAVFLDAALR